MPIKLFFALVMPLMLLLAGCAPLIFTAGAGAGYVATQEEPRSKVGAFFDELGRSIKQTTRKLTGAKPTRKQSAAVNSGGLTLTINNATVAPTKVTIGDQVKLTLQYVVSGAPEKGLKVREKTSLTSSGQELTVLKDETVVKENGTWENTLTFAIPGSAKPGKYTVAQQISAQGKTRSSRRSFTVQ
ncbi:MAG: hypothetical protein JZU50_09405 [Desulfobulbaceae bacterium]|nr:hypothetical protein [Desulfobulbaceae bacterium]